MQYIKLLFLSIFLVGCVTTTRYYPTIPKHPDKAWVEQRLTEMRDSHVRNRGAYNSSEFDDHCVDVYNAIIEWLKDAKKES